MTPLRGTLHKRAIRQQSAPTSNLQATHGFPAMANKAIHYRYSWCLTWLTAEAFYCAANISPRANQNEPWAWPRSCDRWLAMVTRLSGAYTQVRQGIHCVCFIMYIQRYIIDETWKWGDHIFLYHLMIKIDSAVSFGTFDSEHLLKTCLSHLKHYRI